MKMQILTRWSAAAICLLALAACGGGGGDVPATPAVAGPPTPVVPAAVTSFALAAGYQARIVSGATDNFIISGSCAGTTRQSASAASASSFEGTAGFSAVQVSDTTLTNCLPASAIVNGNAYYNAGYVPIGLAVAGGDYAVLASGLANLPSAAKVGDSGVLATLNTFRDSSKATPTGQRVISYLIEADTGTTAILNLVIRSYNTSQQLMVTEESRLRMTQSGALTMVSIDVQFSTSSTVRLLLTRTP